MSIHNQNTSTATRHVGTCGDKRVAVIIQDPNATHEVHVVDTDSLPDVYHQNLMDMLMRAEAQSSKWFGEYMHRQMLFDGTNALRTFYEKNWILQVPVTSVYLTPRPNTSVSLAEELGIMVNHQQPQQQVNQPQQFNPLANNQQPQPQPQPQQIQESNYDNIIAQEQAKLNQVNNPNMPPASDAYNQHVQNFQGDANEQNRLVAANLLQEAKMLEMDAANKRAQAVQYDPSTAQQAATFTPQPQPQPTNTFNPLTETTKVPVVDSVPAQSFSDSVTGKTYSSASALKGAITRRENAAKKTGNG